ncbi:MAG: hypothetical protein JXR30_04120 [Alphaproteobacteria bacterium]|nr:hypothetical protein [Alphaproteobacteria bacterium]
MKQKIYKMENEIFNSTYPVLTHSLTQSFVVFIAVSILTICSKKYLKQFETDRWIEWGLFVVFASLSLSSIFEGETLFSGFVSKIMLAVLFFFMTGRLILKFSKKESKK